MPSANIIDIQSNHFFKKDEEKTNNISLAGLSVKYIPVQEMKTTLKCLFGLSIFYTIIA